VNTPTNTPATLTLRRPDDWHLHLRDGAALEAVLPFTAAQFGRAIVMPNLRPPVTTALAAQDYRSRIQAALPASGPGSHFKPLMTLYLTDNTPPDEIRRAREAGVVALKLYPAGATTNSDAGVTDLDREAVFIDRVMQPLRRDFPELRVVFEHITTADAAQYVQAAGPHTAATLTAHHLLYNRNALFTGGLRPHYYCLPVLKKERHRMALLQAATSGSAKFFLGTDSAPHAAVMKEQSVCGAGCFTAPAALELYAEAFESVGALDKLEGFASLHGPSFYGLPPNTGHVTLARQPWVLPETLPFCDTLIKPLRAGDTLNWKLLEH